MRRRILAVAIALGLLVALYAALGYWMAPGHVREALAGLAADRGLTLDLTTVRTRRQRRSAAFPQYLRSTPRSPQPLAALHPHPWPTRCAKRSAA